VTTGQKLEWLVEARLLAGRAFVIHAVGISVRGNGMLNRSPFDLQTATKLRAAMPRSGDQVSPCRACKVRDFVICGAMEESELPALSSIKSIMEIEPNALLFQEGESADYVFNVTSGVVRVYKLLADG